MKVLFASVVITILAVSAANAQGFPWNDFQRRTMDELVKINEKESVDDFKRLDPQNQLVMRANFLPSKVLLTYTGESREPAEVRRSFIRMWGEAIAKQKNYDALYEREYLFKEGKVEYWLPVQTPVTKYFAKELKPGDTVDLYLVRPGGVRANKVSDWIFLVEEFQKPKTTDEPKP